MAEFYAHGHDLKDPMLSPIYGDFHGLPPAILTTGTRDLLLSNTVRVHRKLRQAGVEARRHLVHPRHRHLADGLAGAGQRGRLDPLRPCHP